jgi:Holliday junction resolvase
VFYSRDNGQYQVKGAIKTMRDAVLKNKTFVVLKYILVVGYIAIFGWKIFIGIEKLELKNIFTNVILIVCTHWALTPSTYNVFDEFLIPTVFGAIDSLTSIIIRVTFSIISSGIGNLQVGSDDPYFLFDSLLQTIFSPVIFTKLLSLCTQGILIFVVPIFYFAYWFLFVEFLQLAMTLLFSRIVIAFAIALLPFGTLLFLGGSFGKGAAKKFYETFFVESVMYIVFYTFLTSVMLSILASQLTNLFNFEVCYEILKFSANSNMWLNVIMDAIGFKMWIIKGGAPNAIDALLNFVALFATCYFFSIAREMVNPLISAIVKLGNKSISGFGGIAGGIKDSIYSDLKDVTWGKYNEDEKKITRKGLANYVADGLTKVTKVDVANALRQYKVGDDVELADKLSAEIRKAIDDKFTDPTKKDKNNNTKGSKVELTEKQAATFDQIKNVTNFVTDIYKTNNKEADINTEEFKKNVSEVTKYLTSNNSNSNKSFKEKAASARALLANNLGLKLDQLNKNSKNARPLEDKMSKFANMEIEGGLIDNMTDLFFDTNESKTGESENAEVVKVSQAAKLVEKHLDNGYNLEESIDLAFEEYRKINGDPQDSRSIEAIQRRFNKAILLRRSHFNRYRMHNLKKAVKKNVLTDYTKTLDSADRKKLDGLYTGKLKKAFNETKNKKKALGKHYKSAMQSALNPSKASYQNPLQEPDNQDADKMKNLYNQERERIEKENAQYQKIIDTHNANKSKNSILQGAKDVLDRKFVDAQEKLKENKDLLEAMQGSYAKNGTILTQSEEVRNALLEAGYTLDKVNKFQAMNSSNPVFYTIAPDEYIQMEAKRTEVENAISQKDKNDAISKEIREAREKFLKTNEGAAIKSIEDKIREMRTFVPKLESQKNSSFAIDDNTKKSIEELHKLKKAEDIWQFKQDKFQDFRDLFNKYRQDKSKQDLLTSNTQSIESTLQDNTNLTADFKKNMQKSLTNVKNFEKSLNFVETMDKEQYLLMDKTIKFDVRNGHIKTEKEQRLEFLKSKNYSNDDIGLLEAQLQAGGAAPVTKDPNKLDMLDKMRDETDFIRKQVSEDDKDPYLKFIREERDKFLLSQEQQAEHFKEKFATIDASDLQTKSKFTSPADKLKEIETVFKSPTNENELAKNVNDLFRINHIDAKDIEDYKNNIENFNKVKETLDYHNQVQSNFGRNVFADEGQKLQKAVDSLSMVNMDKTKFAIMQAVYQQKEQKLAIFNAPSIQPAEFKPSLYTGSTTLDEPKLSVKTEPESTPQIEPKVESKAEPEMQKVEPEPAEKLITHSPDFVNLSPQEQTKWGKFESWVSKNAKDFKNSPEIKQLQKELASGKISSQELSFLKSLATSPESAMNIINILSQHSSQPEVQAALSALYSKFNK